MGVVEDSFMMHWKGAIKLKIIKLIELELQYVEILNPNLQLYLKIPHTPECNNSLHPAKMSPIN